MWAWLLVELMLWNWIIKIYLWIFLFLLSKIKYNCGYESNTIAQKMMFSTKNFFSKCDQICSFLRIWLHLLKKHLKKLHFLCTIPNASGQWHKYLSLHNNILRTTSCIFLSGKMEMIFRMFDITEGIIRKTFTWH